MSLLRQVNAWLFDSAGTAIVADKSGGIRTNTELQSAVHDGVLFSYATHGAIAASTSLILLGRVGAKQVHFDGFDMDISQGPFLIEMFESPTITAVGTQQTPSRRNRANNTASTMLLYSGTTVSANGTLISDDLMLLAGQGVNILSGTATIDDGWVLKANTDYIIKLTNQAASETNYNANFAWHEPTYIV